MTAGLELRPGAEVVVDGQHYRLHSVLDRETVLAENVKTHQTRRLRVRDVTVALRSASAADQAVPLRTDLSTIPAAAWRVAEARYAAIHPLLQVDRRTATMVKQRAEEVGVHMVTLYRWLEHYLAAGQLSALVAPRPAGGHGKSRLTAAVETLVDATIEEHYLTARQPSVPATYNELRRRCQQAGVVPPHVNTLRARIERIAHRTQLQRRGHAHLARDRYEPVTGEFPAADWPLAVVQIDHTLADIIVVDDHHRLPVGRPTITVAIDVYSRMVAGFCVSLDPPNALAVGLCLAQAILPKDAWLTRHRIDTPWPICGLMDSVQADNAPEFRGALLQRACAEYHIHLHWRPVGRPHFGGHIERLCGALNQAIHTLPGTTFSNAAARGEYPSLQRAAMTLSELEHWLTVYVTEVYHQKLHHGIGMSPLKKYEHGVLGDRDHPGCGVRPLPVDPDRLRLDFLPYVERSVQPYGVRIDGIFYYHEVLKPWIRATVTGATRVLRKFIVRRDPRDISTVYFFDPELSQYFPLPYRRLAAPSMSVWELRDVRRRLKAEGQRSIDEAALFASYERLRALEAHAVDTTRKRRRQAQRRRHQQREPLVTPATPPTPSVVDAPEDNVLPFDDLAVGPWRDR